MRLQKGHANPTALAELLHAERGGKNHHCGGEELEMPVGLEQPLLEQLSPGSVWHQQRLPQLAGAEEDELHESDALGKQSGSDASIDADHRRYSQHDGVLP